MMYIMFFKTVFLQYYYVFGRYKQYFFSYILLLRFNLEYCVRLILHVISGYVVLILLFC